MVHLPSFLLATAGLLNYVSAVAVFPTFDVANSNLAIRQISYGLCPDCMGFYFCTEPDWKGKCFHAKALEHYCQNTDPVFDNQISSFGPDKRMVCIVYKEPLCKGEARRLFYPGYANMNDLNFDNVISSYKCWVDEK